MYVISVREGHDICNGNRACMGTEDMLKLSMGTGHA